VSRYGRTEKFDSMGDEAIQTAMRVTKQQQSAHSLIREWGKNFTASLVDLRKKIWA
jgi:ribosome biogenesis protein Tsr3